MTTNDSRAGKPIELPQTKEQFEAEQTANTRINAHVGGYASITHQGGVQTLSVGKNFMEVTPDIDPSVVTVNGMSIKREVYHTLLQAGTLPPGAKIVDPAPHLSKEHTRPFAEGSEEDASLIADESEKTEAKPATDPAADAVFRAGDEVLAAARSTLGEAGVEEAISNAAISGDPTPPPGATPQQVGAVIKAYTESANEMIADAGISVPDLTEALEDADLVDARLAVVSGNISRMKSLAARAVDNLAAMPAKNPERFADYIESKFGSDLDYKIENGRALVMVEGKGYTPWDSIVRMGWLNKAKAVPSGEDGE